MQRRRSRPSDAGERAHGVRLGRPVQDLADQPAGVHAVDALRDRAQRAGEPEPARDDRRQLDGGGGDQPDPLPGVEVHLGERAGARPDPVGHQLVVDLLAERGELVDRPARDERQRGVAVPRRRRVSRPPTRNLICCQAKPSRSDVVKNLRAARPRAKWKIEAPDHHRVVDVEERGGGEVGERGLGGPRGGNGRSRRRFTRENGSVSAGSNRASSDTCGPPVLRTADTHPTSASRPGGALRPAGVGAPVSAHVA